jgi:rare lipoprotein A
MRRSFPTAALALLFTGTALVPAMANPTWASSRGSSDGDELTRPTVLGTEVAIRADSTNPDPGLLSPGSDLAPAPVLPEFKVPGFGLQVLQASTGQASWYGPGFYGSRTANGEKLRRGTLTAAHRTLPFGTRVRVTNLWNGRSAVVRINDRGPFHGNRVIDLAHGAAQELGVASSGVAQVKLEVLR